MPISADKNNFVVLAVGISRDTQVGGLALLFVPLSDEASDLALEVHQQALCAAGALEFVAEFLWYDTGGRRVCSDSFLGRFLGEGGGAAVGGLAV